MKITQEIRTQLEAMPYPAVSVKGRQNFNTAIQTEAKQLHENQMERLIAHISSQGERVARSRSFRDLAKYKRLIKDFLDEAVTYGLAVKQSRSFDRNGRSRKLMLVQSIDDHLAELTEGLMGQEKRSINVLGIIGQIKGLLINLYT
ncbi:YaaR family protein [Halobacillus massiliensis]|uniref:YaaR family protein n=1 Tax=Halobacillus massiliensis TaxID=1926286 RepID=UPI0009E29286|nr:YaaR family protein [Halobacillus massiliensis]